MKIYRKLLKLKIHNTALAIIIAGVLTLGIAPRQAHAQVGGLFENFDFNLDNILSIVKIFVEDSFGLERWLAILDGSLNDPCADVPVL